MFRYYLFHGDFLFHFISFDFLSKCILFVVIIFIISIIIIIKILRLEIDFIQNIEKKQQRRKQKSRICCEKHEFIIKKCFFCSYLFTCLIFSLNSKMTYYLVFLCLCVSLSFFSLLLLSLLNKKVNICKLLQILSPTDRSTR